MKLYLMQLALFQPIAAPVPGYVIQTDDGTNILVDTGLPYSTIGNLEGPPGLQLEMHEADYVVNQLGNIGLRPDDIQLLVCTHFDPDHAGNHEVFPAAELVVQRRHYEIARAGYPRFASVRDHWDHPGLRYRLIDGDTVLVPGVELIETSGHVPGHQSVLVRLSETGPVILAIDAIADQSMLDPDSRPIHPTDEDEAGVRASTRKLVDLARREGVALIVHGHDSQQWPTLRHAPEYYA
jgi:N-acyl homoserine lactone hydrolase